MLFLLAFVVMMLWFLILVYGFGYVVAVICFAIALCSLLICIDCCGLLSFLI